MVLDCDKRPPQALEQFEKRQVEDSDLLRKHFPMGLQPDEILNIARADGISDLFLQSPLWSVDKPFFNSNRLIMPCFSSARIAGFVGHLPGAKAKYINTHGMKKDFFYGASIPFGEEAHLVEGQWDTIHGVSKGLPTYGIMSSSPTREQLISAQGVQRLVFVPDNDDAGRKAVNPLARTWSFGSFDSPLPKVLDWTFVLSVAFINEKDPDEQFRVDPQAYADAINARTTLYEHLVQSKKWDTIFNLLKRTKVESLLRG